MAPETLTAEKTIEAAVSPLDTDGLAGFNMRTPGPSGVSVVKDSSYEVASIAAAALDDIDPSEGDAARRAYTTRPGRSSQVQGHAETRLTFGFLGCASVLSAETPESSSLFGCGPPLRRYSGGARRAQTCPTRAQPVLSQCRTLRRQP
jgi:hypothetical protein